jgi:hypothetical protein
MQFPDGEELLEEECAPKAKNSPTTTTIGPKLLDDSFLNGGHDIHPFRLD